METSEIILFQLGGIRFAAKTGANSFIGSSMGFMCSLPITPKNKANKLRVLKKSANDSLYVVEFAHVEGSNVTYISKHEDVCERKLQKLFTEQTGLHI